MRMVIGCVAVLVLAGFTGAADEKIDAKKLIGKWEPAKKEKDAPAIVIEFAEKGKLSVTFTVNDKAQKIDGTYTVDGNKINVKLSFGGKDQEETQTVSKLTDDELVSKDSKGKEETLKRIKK